MIDQLPVPDIIPSLPTAMMYSYLYGTGTQIQPGLLQVIFSCGILRRETEKKHVDFKNQWNKYKPLPSALCLQCTNE